MFYIIIQLYIFRLSHLKQLLIIYFLFYYYYLVRFCFGTGIIRAFGYVICCFSKVTTSLPLKRQEK